MRDTGMRITPFMGRKQIRANSPYAASAAALNQQFLRSLDDLLSNLRDFCDHVDGMTPAILVEALEPTFGKSLEYCPVKNGDLRASGYLEARKYRQGAEVEIGYGRGGKPTYAIYVHEMPYTHQEPTRSQFLRAAVDEDYFSILNSIPRLVREAAGT